MFVLFIIFNLLELKHDLITYLIFQFHIISMISLTLLHLRQYLVGHCFVIFQCFLQHSFYIKILHVRIIIQYGQDHMFYLFIIVFFIF